MDKSGSWNRHSSDVCEFAKIKVREFVIRSHCGGASYLLPDEYHARDVRYDSHEKTDSNGSLYSSHQVDASQQCVCFRQPMVIVPTHHHNLQGELSLLISWSFCAALFSILQQIKNIETDSKSKKKIIYIYYSGSAPGCTVLVKGKGCI